MEKIAGIKAAIKAKDAKALGALIGSMVRDKNAQYGDSIPLVSDILSIMYPQGIRPNQLFHALAISRVLEKCARISRGDLGDESAWLDIAGYGVLMLLHQQEDFDAGKKM